MKGQNYKIESKNCEIKGQNYETQVKIMRCKVKIVKLSQSSDKRKLHFCLNFEMLVFIIMPVEYYIWQGSILKYNQPTEQQCGH